MMSRRNLVCGVLAAFPTYALLAEIGVAQDALDNHMSAARWIKRQQGIALALSHGELHPQQWQAEVESLARSIDLHELMAEIGRAEVKIVADGLASDPVKRGIVFRDETGARRKLRYATALFTFGRDNVITPHAHRNMVSAHLVVEGAFRVRNFDRVRDEDGAIVIRPTVDETIQLGDVSTMSVDRNNIHWFVPRADRASTFDVIISALHRDESPFKIEPVDPVRGIQLPDGTVRAPILSFEDSSRFYTREI
jgi:hypothetical protein